jgi:FdhE protein
MARGKMIKKLDKRYFEFLGELHAAKASFKSIHGDAVIIDYEHVEKRAKEGRPLIDGEKIELDRELSEELLGILCPILEKYQTFTFSEIQNLMQKRKKIDFTGLTRSVLIGDPEEIKSFANQLNLNSDLLSFLGLNLAQTLFGLFAEKFQDKVDRESWLIGNCPVCGSFPAMEKLRRDDGRRILWCGLCSTQWPYKRIMCPFCGNEDHDSLRYFFTEGDASSDKAAFRVDVCDKCKKYIKTIDERKMPENETPDFSKENINTLYLDILAQRDGYQSPTYLKTQISGRMIVS